MTTQLHEVASTDTAAIHPLGVSCGHCRLKHICLPASLRRNEVEELGNIISHRAPFQQNQHVFREGDKFQSLYAVRAGALKAYKTAPGSKKQVTNFHFPGQMLGMDAISGEVHDSTAIALETSSVCEIPYASLQALSVRRPGLQRRLIALLSRKIIDDQHLITLLGRNNAEERVAILLLRLIDNNILLKLSATHLRLPMRRSDIADHLGLTVETVSRVLSRMHKSDILRIHDREIEIVDKPALMEISVPGESSNSPQPDHGRNYAFR